MAIRDWPQGERPRERLLKSGAGCLSDAELIAIFLRTGVKGRTALDLARLLLQQFGSITRILTSKPDEFCQIPGLGLSKYVQLQAVLELSQRHLQESIQGENVLKNSDATREYLRAKLRNKQNEVFSCLFLDNQHRIVALEELFHGTIDGAPVYPREVVKRCLHNNAAAVIFAHNHPSGMAEPSQADIAITKRLISALNTIEVRVLDHIVVGEMDVVSLAERGLI